MPAVLGVAYSRSGPAGVAYSRSEPAGVAYSRSEPAGVAYSRSEPAGVAYSRSEPAGVAYSRSEPAGVAGGGGPGHDLLHHRALGVGVVLHVPPGAPGQLPLGPLVPVPVGSR